MGKSLFGEIWAGSSCMKKDQTKICQTGTKNPAICRVHYLYFSDDYLNPKLTPKVQVLNSPRV